MYIFAGKAEWGLPPYTDIRSNPYRMNLFRFLFVFIALAFFTTARAQSEDAAIKAVINQFFDGMKTADSTLVLQACTESPVLQTYSRDRQGNLSVRSQDFREFVRIIANPGGRTFDEQIEFGAIQAEVELATVWTPYRFYLDGNLSHCGTNSFQLVKTDAGWKIQYIIDTRRKECD